ncbi:hypothetical protein [Lihuaxuella thermophila]|uniref:Uncharacterized protein n=1 Tax=Lihuaxuella thermophila TaxID=1173111 RepID=A0A1H8JAX2_9BACL|nr:hypothetical protein [Lihuaxuella thermophila]SEN77922.1 hypothetical protein SAMN05444955_12322 [Lihuaxuella thermophila]
MKVIKFSSRRYGKGSNPSGGVYVEVFVENDQEAEILGCKRLDIVRVYERLVSYGGGIPLDGGANPQWKALEEYVSKAFDVPLLKWAEENSLGLSTWYAHMYRKYLLKLETGEFSPEKDVYLLRYKWADFPVDNVVLFQPKDKVRMKEEAEGLIATFFYSSNPNAKTPEFEIKSIEPFQGLQGLNL